MSKGSWVTEFRAILSFPAGEELLMEDAQKG